MKFKVTATSPDGKVEEMVMTASQDAVELGVATPQDASAALTSILSIHPKGFKFPENTKFRVTLEG